MFWEKFEKITWRLEEPCISENFCANYKVFLRLWLLSTRCLFTRIVVIKVLVQISESCFIYDLQLNSLVSTLNDVMLNNSRFTVSLGPGLLTLTTVRTRQSSTVLSLFSLNPQYQFGHRHMSQQTSGVSKEIKYLILVLLASQSSIKYLAKIKSEILLFVHR